LDQDYRYEAVLPAIEALIEALAEQVPSLSDEFLLHLSEHPWANKHLDIRWADDTKDRALSVLLIRRSLAKIYPQSEVQEIDRPLPDEDKEDLGNRMALIAILTEVAGRIDLKEIAGSSDSGIAIAIVEHHIRTVIESAANAELEDLAHRIGETEAFYQNYYSDSEEDVETLESVARNLIPVATSEPWAALRSARSLWREFECDNEESVEFLTDHTNAVGVYWEYFRSAVGKLPTQVQEYILNLESELEDFDGDYYDIQALWEHLDTVLTDNEVVFILKQNME
jgi:hypothetical protein